MSLFEGKDPIRVIITGMSGSGKTYFLIQCLLAGEFKFDKLFIFRPGSMLEEYTFIATGLNYGLSLPEMKKIWDEGYRVIDPRGKERTYKNIVTLITDVENIPNTSDGDGPKVRKLIIFDDCLEYSKNGKISNLFTRGRPDGWSCIFLTQSYFELEGRLIRGNTTHLVIFSSTINEQREIKSRVLWSEGAQKQFKLALEKINEPSTIRKCILIDMIQRTITLVSV